MTVKDKQDDAKDELKRLAEKYSEDPQAFAKGYAELERKLSEQGKELGTLRKQAEKAQEAADNAKQWKPIVDWYNANYPAIQQMFSQAKNGQNQTQHVQQAQQMQQSQQVQQAAVQQAQATIPGFDWMTPQEQTRLVNGIAQDITQRILAPWTQTFAKNVESWAETQKKQMFDQFNKQQQASMDVLWRTFEQIVDKDKLDRARTFHTEALKYADPSKINPMDLAHQTLEARTKQAAMEEELKQLKADKEAREKATTPSLGANPSSTLFQPALNGGKPSPQSPDDRFARVMETVNKEHGGDAVRETFPALR